MKSRMRWGVALAAWAIVGCGEDPEPTVDDYTRSVMREIFEGIRVALPASVDSAVFKAPNNQGEIFAALENFVCDAHQRAANRNVVHHDASAGRRVGSQLGVGLLGGHDRTFSASQDGIKRAQMQSIEYPPNGSSQIEPRGLNPLGLPDAPSASRP